MNISTITIKSPRPPTTMTTEKNARPKSKRERKNFKFQPIQSFTPFVFKLLFINLHRFMSNNKSTHSRAKDEDIRKESNLSVSKHAIQYIRTTKYNESTKNA